ncbi:MAG TPA: CBS domain-containing protein [Gemmatirosa sp.]
MQLSDYVRADRVVIPLEGATLHGAGRALLQRLVDTGAVAHPERLWARVDEERPEDLVAMSDHAFLLHYRSDAMRELAVAIGTSTAPVARELGESDERQQARIVLLVAAPPKQAARYLQVVGALARLLSRDDVITAVLRATDASAVAQLAAFRDVTLRDQLAVRDLMTERPRSVAPETPLRDAALAMTRANVAGLPVVESDGRVIGILGQRELLQHLLTEYLDRAGAPRPAGAAERSRVVRDVMTRQVLCVSPDQPLAEVAAMMTNKDVDRVPVVREGLLVGFLTRGDIVRKLVGS